MNSRRGWIWIVLLITSVGLLGLQPATAFAASFSEASPAQGTILTQRSTNVKFTVKAVATPGQQIASTATIVVDGQPQLPATVSYRIDHWEDFYDEEYGVWYQIPIYDYTQATISYTVALPPGAHTATVSVRESPSNSTFMYAWTLSAENCTTCHQDQPSAHSTGNCAACHTTSGPVLFHNTGSFGGCDNCHDISGHGADRLAAHTYYDLDGNPTDVPARACTHCHASQYEWIPQVSANHGDAGSAHGGVAEADCAECHGSDITGIHASCDSCHAAGIPAPGTTCSTCHTSIHGNAAPAIYGVPGSSWWSLALVGAGGLFLAGRRMRYCGPRRS
jgi:hypothetical protein